MPRNVFYAIIMIGLGGCGQSPQSIGITGAPLAAPPEAEGDNVILAPGIPQGNSTYNPSVLPTTGGGRFYGY